ncbi:MAG: bifunctional riboflavin kinase/FAD synthetase [Pseudomonadota bacterium]|nr:bifunctional riboflavin kinase/FAD synthetase [Pseudomonadota bacterium]
MNSSHNQSCETIDWCIGDGPLTGAELGAAIGNFDGVHRGHGKVISAAIEAARISGLVSAVVTFDPHPREFFRHDDAPFHLADRHEKDRLIAALGVDRIIHVRFDDNLRCTDAENFVTSVLPALGVKALFAGSDFAFGRGRGGDIDTINEIGAGIGISATPVTLLSDPNSAVISSSRVRAALQDGEPERAAEMLGHDWAVTGTVQMGDQRGRTIGFPTANIPLGNLLHPAFGVYAVQIYEAEAGQPYLLLGNGVANIGVRPTVEDRGVLCEAHLFDQQIDLYGRRLAIGLKSFLRPERKFTGIDELTAQIAKDARAARALLPPIKQTA